MYLGAQGIVNINWDKLQSISQGVLSTVVNTINSTAGGVGESPAASSSSLLPTTTNLGIPLTSSMAMGFTIGILKG